MPNYIYIATSLDGYIATKDGGIDWLMDVPNPDNSDFGFKDFMDHVDALIMGSNTFEKLLTFDEWLYTKKVFVLSNSLKEIPEKLKDKAEIVSGKIPDVMNSLNSKGYHNFYIDGGKVIQSFLQLDLIDEIIITSIPILLGEGISLFGSLAEPLKFKFLKTEVFNDSLVKSYYQRIRH